MERSEKLSPWKGVDRRDLPPFASAEGIVTVRVVRCCLLFKPREIGPDAAVLRHEVNETGMCFLGKGTCIRGNMPFPAP